LVLLPRPIAMRNLQYFQGMQLTFSLLGHDILGRPICDVYYNGIPLDSFADYKYLLDYFAGTGYSSQYYVSSGYSSYYSTGSGYSGTYY